MLGVRGEMLVVTLGALLCVACGLDRSPLTGLSVGDAATADAGESLRVECTGPSGTSVRLQGVGYDEKPMSDLSFAWVGPFPEGGGKLFGAAQTVTLPPGAHHVALEVSDEHQSSVPVGKLIVVEDTTAPTLIASFSPGDLWPPNHKYIHFIADVTTSDACSANVALRLVSIVSNEPEDSMGDGTTSPDIAGAEFGTRDLEFDLRSERTGTGDGRTYSVTYEAVDTAGNLASLTSTVFVRHSSP